MAPFRTTFFGISTRLARAILCAIAPCHPRRHRSHKRCILRQVPSNHLESLSLGGFAQVRRCRSQGDGGCGPIRRWRVLAASRVNPSAVVGYVVKGALREPVKGEPEAIDIAGEQFLRSFDRHSSSFGQGERQRIRKVHRVFRLRSRHTAFGRGVGMGPERGAGNIEKPRFLQCQTSGAFCLVPQPRL
jgi:hypothetical protein